MKGRSKKSAEIVVHGTNCSVDNHVSGTQTKKVGKEKKQKKEKEPRLIASYLRSGPRHRALETT